LLSSLWAVVVMVVVAAAVAAAVAVVVVVVVVAAAESPPLKFFSARQGQLPSSLHVSNRLAHTACSTRRMPQPCAALISLNITLATRNTLHAVQLNPSRPTSYRSISSTSL
jgi:hypothetical protein